MSKSLSHDVTYQRLNSYS